jgi:hypothetical protein
MSSARAALDAVQPIQLARPRDSHPTVCRERALPRLTCPVLRRLWPICSGHVLSVHPRRQLSRVVGA